VRTPQNEITLTCLRTISILLSKSKYQRSGDNNCNFIIQTLLGHICQFGLVDVCLQLMRHILFDYWRKQVAHSTNIDSFDESVTNSSGKTLTAPTPAPTVVNSSSLMKFSDEARYYEELAPFFVNDPLNKDSFVIPPPNLANASETPPSSTSASGANAVATSSASKITASASSQASNKIDLFDNYVELLTEILIRLPYQMKKLCLGSSGSTVAATVATQGAEAVSSLSQYQQLLAQIATTAFDFAPWTHYLCEYLLLGPPCYYLKRLIKKLLQMLCGSKDKYRKFKDQHILSECTGQLTRLCALKSAPVPQSLLTTGNTLQECADALSTLNLSAQSATTNAPTNPTATATSSSNTQHATPAVVLAKLNYVCLLRIAEQLKQMLEIASARTANWQRFVLHNPRMLLYLCDLAMLMGVDANGSGSDSSNLNGTSSISTACTNTTPALIPSILQLLILTLGKNISFFFVCIGSRVNQKKNYFGLFFLLSLNWRVV
jgi:hypothetical protein